MKPGPPQAILVTGCSGFIGSHVMDGMSALASWRIAGLDRVAPEIRNGGDAPDFEFLHADLEDREALRRVAVKFKRSAVVHLAALGEVVFPFSELGTLYATNVLGSYNALLAFEPKLVVFASSSSVYGHVGSCPARERWEEVHPVGHYGMSKAACELLLNDWARKGGEHTAVSLRLGNVVGERCRGLVPYLVEHACRNPQGSPAVRLRGGGRMVRDYVPVETVCRALIKTATMEWAGGAEAINVATGRGLSNKDVFEIVEAELRQHGLHLTPAWSAEAAFGEAKCSVLDPTRMESLFGLPAPTATEVLQSIRCATRAWLEEFTGQINNARPDHARTLPA